MDKEALRATNQLFKRPSQVLMVGDSVRKDVQGPQVVGIQAVWLRTTSGDTQDDAEGVTAIQQPQELLSTALR